MLLLRTVPFAPVWMLLARPSEATTARILEKGNLTKHVLDAIASLEGEQLDLALWTQITTCMNAESTPELNLLEVSDAAWTGFLDYGESKGALDGSDAWGVPSQFIEFNATPLSADSLGVSSDIVIEQPCNTVSNIAYYHTMIAMCDYADWTMSQNEISALASSFALLVPSSSLFHASNTALGGTMDSQAIRLAAFIAFQAAVESLPYSPVTHELSISERNYTGIQALEAVSQLILQESVYEWKQSIDDLQTPRYELSFGAMVSTLSNLLFTPKLASELTKFLGNLLTKDTDTVNFIEFTFQPALLEGLAAMQIKIDLPSRLSLLSSSVGTLVKMASEWLRIWHSTVGLSVQALTKLFYSLISSFLLLYGRKRHFPSPTYKVSHFV
jgi:hypothetical protein